VLRRGPSLTKRERTAKLKKRGHKRSHFFGRLEGTFLKPSGKRTRNEPRGGVRMRTDQSDGGAFVINEDRWKSA